MRTTGAMPALMCGAAGAAQTPAVDKASTDKPNVLFITIDDMNDGIALFGTDCPFDAPAAPDLE